MNSVENVPYVKGEKRQDSNGWGKKKKNQCRRVHVRYVCVCPGKAGEQQKGQSQDLELGSLVEWVVVKGGEGLGCLGCLPRPRGISKAAHICSDMQQIVKALLSHA